MKILWVNTHFLHPPTRGGQIRTLEMLRRLHQRHEIHYLGLQEDPNNLEAVPRSVEYCSKAYAIPHKLPARMSLAFGGQAVMNLFSSEPLAVARYRSAEALRTVADLQQREHFDRIICDFLFSVPNIPVLEQAVLFAHNVETTIWRRHVEVARGPLQRAFFRREARRMETYERGVCQRVSHVVAVSPEDSDRMRRMFNIEHVSAIPTGVDVDYFRPPESRIPAPAPANLVFVGSMDWLPNIDGASWFVNEILPLIRRRIPHCSLVIAGRRPTRRVLDLARDHPGITVTGTVDDIRPYLWGSSAAVVPLRIGGGTRLKIFEAMAAGIPIVSTSVGAEGLPLSEGEHILIADSAQAFADRCLDLLENPDLRSRVAESALETVSARFSWEHVAACFEQILEKTPPVS
jgi:sugar transferase (PEP-CTERM/EpsH1 system associated)